MHLEQILHLKIACLYEVSHQTSFSDAGWLELYTHVLVSVSIIIFLSH